MSAKGKLNLAYLLALLLLGCSKASAPIVPPVWKESDVAVSIRDLRIKKALVGDFRVTVTPEFIKVRTSGKTEIPDYIEVAPIVIDPKQKVTKAKLVAPSGTTIAPDFVTVMLAPKD